MEPKSRIDVEYLMTVYVPLHAPQVVTSNLHIYTSKPGGWVSGPRIKGDVVAPTADWLRVMPNGVRNLDVRLSILADDGCYIYMQYVGRIVNADRLRRWPNPPVAESHFMINPVFETDSEKYDWLNDLICIGKNIERKVGDDRCVTYEIFNLS
jgi:hypothetical protein